MGTSNLVGRVGGLAVALGVGAAAFSASTVAWADTPAAGPDTPSAGADADSVTPAAAPRRSANPARVVGGAAPRSAAPTPSGPRTSLIGASRSAARASVAPPSALPAVRADPAPAAKSAPVSEMVSAPVDMPGDPPAEGSPAVPVGSPLEWTGLAVSRRASAASTEAVPSLAATLPLILGPSGVPIPSTAYVEKALDWYVLPNSPGGANLPQVVFTPEGLYPITGVKSLPLTTSVDQGLTILSDTLALLPDATVTTVFGYSQSAIIGSLLQAGYIPPNSPYPDPTIPGGLQNSINFVFVGNEMNPNGGFLSRFPNLNLPSLGINFYGATPENLYPTTNYTREYDGFADFPRYPLNVLSVLNAGLGIIFVHTKYTPAADCRTFCLTQLEVENAIALPSTSPTQKYFFMPTENLPLLEPLRLIPLIGNPIADLIQPVLKVIVNLGYGDPAHGFSSAIQPDANVLVPFGLFPDVSPLEVLSQLVAGVEQGISDFIADFGPNGSIAQEISALTPPALSLSLPMTVAIIPAIQNAISALADRISASAAGLYAALLPTADIINAIAISLPAYSINLALTGLQQAFSGDPVGGLINAIGLPLAASAGLITTASLIAVLVWLQGVVAVIDPNYVIGG